MIYDNRYGGYGYYNTLGTWVAYDMLSDAIMMNAVLNRDYVNRTTVVHTSSGGSALGFIFTFILIGGVIVVAVIFMKRGR